MANVFILCILSTLILLAGCNSSNNSSETASPQFVFQQSATPLELSIEPSIIALGQTANITVKTAPGAFVFISIISPDQPSPKGFRYTYYLLRNLTDLQSSDMADDKGIFTTNFRNRVWLEKDDGLLANIPGYYRVIATAESRGESRRMGSEWSHSGNVTIIITSFLVR